MDLSGFDTFTIEVPSEEGTRELDIRFVMARYERGGEGIYLGFDFFDSETREWDGPTDVTTNAERVPFMDLLSAHVNLGDVRDYLGPVMDVLEENGLIERSGLSVRRGFSEFESVRFDPRILDVAMVMDDGIEDDWRFALSFPDLVSDREIEDAPEDEDSSEDERIL